MTPTEALARFIVETRFESIPGKVVAAAKTSILDTIGVTLAAIPEGVGQSIIRYVREMGGSPAAAVIGAGLKTSPPWAALANGTLAHALDFDDSNNMLNGHASVGVLPAALAQAETRGASGREVIEAYVIGFEVASKLGAGMNMALHRNGWHPTCVLGAMGAAAAASKLRGLGVEATRMALGCAASHASGLRANFGTMMKPVHAGLAAEAGVRAAGLAAAGVNSHTDVLDAKAGFCETFSGPGKYRMADIIDRLGNPFVLDSPGVNLKPYPCCMSSHISVDVLRGLMEKERFTGADVESVDVDLLEPNYVNLRHHDPRTGLEGKFSGEYILSRLLLDGALRLDTFTDGAVNAPAARAMMERVRVHMAEGEVPHGAPKPATVTVRTRDGRTFRQRGERSRGNASLPLSREEIHGKFRDCARRRLAPGKIEKVLGVLVALENLPDIRSLMADLA
ncbi:MAG: MmgE/PrpD family protein [Nitrospinota bacterium]